MYSTHPRKPMKALLGMTFSALLIGISSLAMAQQGIGVPQAWGYNFFGALGDGTKINRSTPVTVLGVTGISQVAEGYDFTLVLKSDGTVWTWGGGSANAVQVAGLTDVVQVAAGHGHSLALKSDGTLWAWGSNGVGQLGDGTTTSRNSPVQVTGITDVVNMAGGGAHSLAVKSDGTVWAWGWNNATQLGTGTNINYSTVPLQAVNLTGVVQVAAGFYQSLAVKSDGTAWGWGMNTNGQVGDGSTTSRNVPVQVSGLTGVLGIIGGGTTSLAVKLDGTVWGWGYNGKGGLGDGTTAQRNTPVRMTGVTGAVQVAAGDNHSLVLKSDGTVWAVGGNNYGQLGVGTTNDSSSAVQVLNLTGQTNIAARQGQSISVQATPLDAPRKSAVVLGNVTTTYGNVLTLKANLTQLNTTYPLGGRNVTFLIDGTVVGAGRTVTSGAVSVTLPNAYSVGNHVATVMFDGDTTFGTSSGNATLTITRASTSLGVKNAVGTLGQTVNLIATLTRQPDKATIEGRTVNFQVNGMDAGSAVTDSKGVATLAYHITEALGVGSVNITASFAGDTSYRKVNSNTAKLTTNKGKTAVTSASATVTRGVDKTLTALLKNSTDGTLLSGKSVTFDIAGIGTFMGTTNASGVASVTINVPKTTAIGKYTLTVSFAGDSLYLSSTKSGYTITLK